MKKILTIIILTSTLLNVNTTMAQSNNHIYDKDYIKGNKLSSAVVQEVVINAPQSEVWKVISNWGDAYIYTPGLDKSYCTGNSKTGLNSKRHCDIGKGSVEEEVLVWEEGSRFVQQVYEMNKIPMMKKIIVELEVIALTHNTSKLIYAMAYKMPMGKLMKGMIKKGITNNAYATKHYVETGDSETAKDPKRLEKLYLSKNTIEEASANRNDKPYYQLALIWVKDDEKFQEYITRVTPVVEKYGGKLDRMFAPTSIYAEGMEKPQIINLVHYSSKEAYEKMNADEAFRKIVQLRDASIDLKSFEGYLSKSELSAKMDSSKTYNIEIAGYKNGDPKLYNQYEVEGETAMQKYGYNVEFLMKLDRSSVQNQDFVKISSWDDESGHKNFEKDEMHDKIENELYPPAVDNLIWITARIHPFMLK